VLVDKLRAGRFAALRQLLGEDPGVTAFVAGGVGAAHDVIGKRAVGRFDLEQLAAADHPAVHTETPHQRGGLRCRVKRLLVGVVMRDAALQPVVDNAGALHDVLERHMAVGPQCHDLLDVAAKGRVGALA